MKVKVDTTVFQSVTITLETQEELDKMYAIASFAPISDALDFHELFEAMWNIGGSKLAPGYSEWLGWLREAMIEYGKPTK